MRLQIAAAIAVGITTLASALLGILFRLSVKREAPLLYETLWKPVTGGATLRLDMVPVYLKMIYLRRYRTILADYRRSRAWASWVFATNWLQLMALAALLLLTLDKP